MKKALIPLFIFLIITSSCSNTTRDSSAKSDSATQSKLVAPVIANEIQINSSFPFGYTGLINYNYPKFWEGDLENYGHLKQPSGKEFEKIGQYFEEIHTAETQKTKPETLEVKHLKIGVDFIDTVYFDTLTQQKTDSLKFRLPDIGNYHCFYFFENSKNGNSSYGNLLLVDPKTKSGKTLNIYYRVGEEQSITYRYFYMNNDTIKIYQGYCYDDGCSLAECFLIKIDEDGTIIISAVN